MTKKSAERDDLFGLKVLAMVLNLDFETGTPQDLASFKHLSGYDFMVESVLNRDDPDEKKRANDIRMELRADLESIIAPEGKVSADEAYGRIRKLIEKINKIEIQPVWGVAPVDYKWCDDDEDIQLIPKEAEDERETTWYWSSSRTVELLGYKWFIGVQGVPAAFAFSRDELCSTIRHALQIGVFDRLRICPHCKKFFVAEDVRQQFCSDQHRNEFNNKQRLRSGYFSDLRDKARTKALKKARELKRQGKSAAEIQKQTGLSLRILKREKVITQA